MSSSNSSGNGPSVNGRVREKAKNSKAILFSRVLFILCLLCTAVIFGYLGFAVSARAEEKLAEEQFYAITERALISAQTVTQKRQYAAITLSEMVAAFFSDENDWPSVAMPRFEEIASGLLASSGGRVLSFIPIVALEQRQDFEDFAYNYYREQYGENTTVGMMHFGPGIWGVAPSSLPRDEWPYHDVTGETPWGSPYQFLAPYFQAVSSATASVENLMFNLHWEPTNGREMDKVMRCSEERQNNRTIRCESISDFYTVPPQVQVSPGPGTILMQPIYPAQNGTRLAGFISSGFVWSIVVRDVFSQEVGGIDCVVITNTTSHTYRVAGGTVDWLGVGNLIEKKYESYATCKTLTLDGLTSTGSTSYRLCMYPSQAFFRDYETNNPRNGVIGAMATLLLTSIIFLGYDMFVRRDIKSKQSLLEAKRSFVRFVSHEVRTPLNSVIMGLTLLEQELSEGRQLGKSSFKCLDSLGNQSSQSTLLLEDSLSPMHNSKSNNLLEHTKEVHENALRAVDVLNDLLNYDKIEMGALKLELTIVSILPLIRQTVGEFEGPTSQRKIALKIDFENLLETDGRSKLRFPGGEGCRTVGDAVRLAQVIRNILSNAIKFTSEGGTICLKANLCEKSVKTKSSVNTANSVKPQDSTFEDATKQVALTLKRGDTVQAMTCGFLDVHIMDSGVGLSKQQIELLFGDGVQFNVNELQHGNGTGIGLHIAKGIMELHGGDLIASSEGLGKGTTFTMRIPLYRLSPEDDSQCAIDEEIPPLRIETGASGVVEEEATVERLRILIVDDAEMNRKLLSRMLTKNGHECTEAVDGDVAVEMFRTSMQDHGADYYHTILLDHEMPRLSGPEAAKQIREMNQNVLIVGVTGNLLPDDIEYFKQCGADFVLPKPFKLSALQEIWAELDTR